MVAGHFMALAALFVKAHPKPTVLCVNVLDLQASAAPTRAKE
jgi:hypothetical protein